MGDIVHTLPAVAAIKRSWPETRLRWLVNPEWAPLLEGNPDVDEPILFPRRELAGIRNVAKQIRWLRGMRAACKSDLVLDFQGLLRSAIIGRTCRADSASRFIGLSDSREGSRYFYDQIARVGQPGCIHAADRYLALAAAAGATAEGELAWRLPLGIFPAGFALREPFVLFHPFSRGAGKSLSAEQVEAFCKTLPLPVVLAGRVGTEMTQTDWPSNATNLLNRTSIPELIWLLRKAAFVVSVDSGPMHIAAAITPRLLSIHTWSDPALVGPYNPEAWVWKDRTLFQVRELQSPAAVQKRRAAPDIQAVAAFVEEQMTGAEKTPVLVF